MICSTRSGGRLESAARSSWDVLVIGAGPAGSLAATLLARSGLEVLLVDARPFPREKACGGCLNSRAVAILQRYGLEDVLDRSAAMPISSLRLACGRHAAGWPLAGSLAIDRTRFDHALAQSAVQAGAVFLESTRAVVHPAVVDPAHDGPVRRVSLKQNSTDVLAEAGLVLAADGLSHSSLRRLPEFTDRVSRSSRIGLGGTLPDRSRNYPPGELTMAVSAAGYVGLVRTAAGHLSLGAAVDAGELARAASPAELLQQILGTCGFPAPEWLEGATLRGTPPLTRRASRCAAHRLLVLGDAAGYVEPFTGEGIAWAMLSAVLAVPLAIASRSGWQPEMQTDWQRTLQRKVVRNQWTCRLLARLLRSPMMAGLSLEVCRRMPAVPRTILSRIGGKLPASLPPVLEAGPSR